MLLWLLAWQTPLRVNRLGTVKALIGKFTTLKAGAEGFDATCHVCRLDDRAPLYDACWPLGALPVSMSASAMKSTGS